jgi:aldos-2-ulose dehydratase/isomerase family protein/VCBS repeat protein
MKPRLLCLAALLLGTISHGPAAVIPPFRTVEIDSKIAIGYAVTVADVDGDHKPDILVVDKKQIVWYRNPGWERFVIAENLTELDNVCIAAADIDGDGKAEIAVGAGWNPGDTINSGAVFYLIPPQDRTQKWETVELPHEPTVHRMRWMKHGSRGFDLVVVPLHGRGNKGGEGAGVRILRYKMPSDPHKPWTTELVNDSFHMSHNLDLIQWSPKADGELLVAAKEGVFHLTDEGGAWKSHQLAGNDGLENGFKGAGEVRHGKLPNGRDFLVTVEPMHGNQVAIYSSPEPKTAPGVWHRQVIDSSLNEGHAVACGDLLGTGSDQVVVGWRGKDAQGKVGIKVFIPVDPNGKEWSQQLLDDNAMACEDLCLADLNGDGKLDIIASGRATKNVKIYFNERGKGSGAP